jgi:hypothetical protein
MPNTSGFEIVEAEYNSVKSIQDTLHISMEVMKNSNVSSNKCLR